MKVNYIMRDAPIGCPVEEKDLGVTVSVEMKVPE